MRPTVRKADRRHGVTTARSRAFLESLLDLPPARTCSGCGLDVRSAGVAWVQSELRWRCARCVELEAGA